jgi:hypothetical protein
MNIHDDTYDPGVNKALALENAKWWNSRFKAERINEMKEIQDAIARHPSSRGN